MATLVDRTPAAEAVSAHSHWCHECSELVGTTYNETSSEHECDCCGGCFVEEIEEENDGQSTDHPRNFVPETNEGEGSLPAASSSTSSNAAPTTGQMPLLINQILDQARATTTNRSESAPGATNPVSLQQFFQQLNEGSNATPGENVGRSNGVEIYVADGTRGAPGNIQNFLNDSGIGNIFHFPTGGAVGGGLGLAGNIGDYAFGNLSNIINHLMQNDPNQSGTPPASKSAISSLPVVKIDQSIVDKGEDCAVCKDLFVVGDESRKLPCEHLFHPSCILPWLKQHSSCPICRHELPTDDQDYEQQKEHRS